MNTSFASLRIQNTHHSKSDSEHVMHVKHNQWYPIYGSIRLLQYYCNFWEDCPESQKLLTHLINFNNKEL